MPSPINVVMMMHGMIIEPVNQPDAYNTLWGRLVEKQHALTNASLFDQTRVHVLWADTHGDADLGKERIDTLLTTAQNNIVAKVADGDFSGLSPFDPAAWVLQKVFRMLHENLLIRGLGDAVFYCSAEGETAMRRVVYGALLDHLTPYEETDREVRLHIIAHSLGVTIAHDLLFGLFAADAEWDAGVPDFVHDRQSTAAHREKFTLWRERAHRAKPTFRFGSFSASASQLPVTLLRSAKVIRKLQPKSGKLDSASLGIAGERVQWKIFVDPDDALGFRSKELYLRTGAIEEYSVNAGFGTEAHTGYWQNETVIEHTAALLVANAGGS
jgi:hypothetical protein